MKNKSILKIRKKLDVLDNKLLDIIKKRSKLVDLVIKNKKYKKDIIDKERINKILNNIKIKSKQKKIDQKITNRIWISMIIAFIYYEFRNFKKKKIIIYYVEVIFFNKIPIFSCIWIIFLNFNSL